MRELTKIEKEKIYQNKSIINLVKLNKNTKKELKKTLDNIVYNTINSNKNVDSLGINLVCNSEQRELLINYISDELKFEKEFFTNKVLRKAIASSIQNKHIKLEYLKKCNGDVASLSSFIISLQSQYAGILEHAKYNDYIASKQANKKVTKVKKRV